MILLCTLIGAYVLIGLVLFTGLALIGRVLPNPISFGTVVFLWPLILWVLWTG